MSKVEKNAMAFEAVKRYVREKWKDLLVIGVLAVALLFAISRVFRDNGTETVATQMTETELKVSRLLQQIQGVGGAEVIVCETEDGEKNVVIVCDGAKNIRVVMDVREAVAAALGTDEKAIKIYQKK
ncbi:MAG: hypothetical protein IJ373_07730 [Clostridia bacterium]|nr:hypothetical protein [Clostridia bacterium]